MYSSDTAIKTKTEDLLGRAHFASELANAILKNTGKDSIVIGLYGSWGSGKTSLVNMVLEEIENLTIQDEDKPLLVSFAPWNFSAQENLVSVFFKTLRLYLNIEKNKKWEQKIGNALDKFADTWDVLTLYPGAGTIVAPAAKAITKLGANKLLGVKPIDEAKKEIERVLLERNQKIIVVIDDVDRLEKSQICAVFQLVKQIVSFPNTTYLLPMDRDIVARALKKVQDDDGYSYLEKIVQIPFIIPEISKTKMKEVFVEKVNGVLNANNVSSLDKNYYNSVIDNCVQPLIRNLRDIYRVVNTLEFKIGLLRGEICIEDLIGMTAIDVLNPCLFSWIRENRTRLCGDISFGDLFVTVEKPTVRKERYISSLKEAGVKDKNINRDLMAVATLFPHFANEIEQHVANQSSDNIKKSMRVAELKRSDLLFGLDLDNVAIPRSVITDSLTQYSKDEFGDLLNRMNKDERIMYYLDESEALIDIIPYDRLPIIIKEIWTRKQTFKGSSSPVLSVSWKAEAFVDKLLERLQTNKERYGIIKGLLENADISGIESLGRGINRIELAYGRLAGYDQENKQNQIIDLDQLKKIESIYANRAIFLANNTDIFKDYSLVYYSYLWRAFSKESYDSFIYKHITDDRFLLRFICRLAGEWIGTAGKEWSYKKDFFFEYLSDQEIYKKIENYDKTKIDQDFDDEELLRIASFYLNFEKDDNDEQVTAEEAAILVKTWREKKHN